jgi:transcriptional regulator with XRE-family HTH domain
MEKYGSVPAANSFVRIANYFDVSLDYLLCNDRKLPEYFETLVLVEDSFKGIGLADKFMREEDRALFADILKIVALGFLAGATRIIGQEVSVEKVAALASAEEESQDGNEAERDEKRRAFAREAAERIKVLSKARGMSVRNVLSACNIQANFVSSMTSRGAIPAADCFVPIATTSTSLWITCLEEIQETLSALSFCSDLRTRWKGLRSMTS